MAVKKPEQTPEVEQNVALEATSTPIDPWRDMREISLPRPGKGEETHVLVGVNSRYLRVKKGVAVKVPRPIYEVLVRMMKAEQAEDDYQRSVDNKNFNIGDENAAPSNL